MTNERTADGIVQDELAARAVLEKAISEGTAHVLLYDAEHEYERGKQHGADDRRMIERRNQEQGREINDLKTEISKLKMELYELRFGAKKTV